MAEKRPTDGHPGTSASKPANEGAPAAYLPTDVVGPTSHAAARVDDEDRPPPIAIHPGSMIGEYRVTGNLGRGGFGTVYRAIHPVIEKKVAIKVLHPRFSADAAFVARFVAEARAVNRIEHNNIIDIFAFGQLDDGRHYYVMEFLDGMTLASHLKQRGRLGLDEALPILGQVGSALDSAHGQGIVHRDLKPDNVFLVSERDRPSVKLLDFGIAKLIDADEPADWQTETGAPLGTPYYMSPEQCRGKDVDHRTDIYAFGVMTYQCLTGTLPFAGGNFTEIVLKQISETPKPPSAIVEGLPAHVDTGILAMLEKDAASRPATLAAALELLGGPCTTSATTSSMGDLLGDVVTPASELLPQPPTKTAATGREDGVKTASPESAPAARSRWKVALFLAAAVAIVIVAAATFHTGFLAGSDSSSRASTDSAAVISIPPFQLAGVVYKPQVVGLLVEPHWFEFDRTRPLAVKDGADIARQFRQEEALSARLRALELDCREQFEKLSAKYQGVLQTSESRLKAEYGRKKQVIEQRCSAKIEPIRTKWKTALDELLAHLEARELDLTAEGLFVRAKLLIDRAEEHADEDSDANYEPLFPVLDLLAARFPESPLIPRVLFLRATYLQTKGEDEERAALYLQLGYKYPDSPLATWASVRGAGPHYYVRGELEKAESAYSWVAESDSDAARKFHDEAGLMLAWIHTRMGRFDRAIDDWCRVLPYVPPAVAPLEGVQKEAVRLLALISYLEKDTKTLGEPCKQMTCPCEERVLARLASMYVHSGEIANASAVLQLALGTYPMGPLAPSNTCSYIHVLERQGQADVARRLRADMAKKFAPHSAWAVKNRSDIEKEKVLAFTDCPAPLAQPAVETADGGAGQSTVTSTLENARPALERCYIIELLARPETEGDVVFSIDVGPGGAVRTVRQRSDALGNDVIACLAAVLTRQEYSGLSGNTLSVPLQLRIQDEK